MITHTGSMQPRLILIIQDDEMACTEARWLQRMFGPAVEVRLVPTVGQAIALLANPDLPVDMILCDLSRLEGSTTWETVHALAAAIAPRLMLIIPLVDGGEGAEKAAGATPRWGAPCIVKSTLNQGAFEAQVHALWRRWQILCSALRTVQVLGEPLPERQP